MVDVRNESSVHAAIHHLLDAGTFVETWLLHSLGIGEWVDPVLLSRCLRALGWTRNPDTALVVRVIPSPSANAWMGDGVRSVWRQEVNRLLDLCCPRRLSLWNEALQCLVLTGREGAPQQLAQRFDAIAHACLQLGARIAMGLAAAGDGCTGLSSSLAQAREAALQAAFFGQPLLHAEDMDDGLALLVDAAGQVVQVQRPERPGVDVRLQSVDQGSPGPASRSPIVQTAIEFIQSHLAEELSLSSIARHCAVSPYHLSHLFRKEMDTTLTAYIKRARLEVAKQLLADRAISIAEAGYRAGFSDPNYFSKAFRSAYGMSPSEFRRSLVP